MHVWLKSGEQSSTVGNVVVLVSVCPNGVENFDWVASIVELAIIIVSNGVESVDWVAPIVEFAEIIVIVGVGIVKDVSKEVGGVDWVDSLNDIVAVNVVDPASIWTLIEINGDDVVFIVSVSVIIEVWVLVLVINKSVQNGPLNPVDVQSIQEI